MKLNLAFAVGFGLSGLIPQLAQASEESTAITSVAASQMSTVARINGTTRAVIYVGEFDGCDSVAIQNSPDRFDHFRVCGDQVIPRSTVSPSWTEADGGNAVLKAVVSNAVLFGAASQTDANGYLIVARTLGSAQIACTNVEVVISYDGDLVDRALKSICSHRR